MGSDFNAKVIVIMGVSGAGKSVLPFCLLGQNRKTNTLWDKMCEGLGGGANICTIGWKLAKVMNCDFLDADDFHPQSNKEKMHRGVPLSEEDRIPWLENICDSLRGSIISGKSVVLACSALQTKYREILRSADSSYQSGSYTSCVKFILLDTPIEVLAMRLEKRAAEGKHFMPTALLQSQLDLLQIDNSEGIYKVDNTLRSEAVVTCIQTLINQSS